MRPSTGMMQRFVKGEMFSISSRSRLESWRRHVSDEVSLVFVTRMK